MKPAPGGFLAFPHYFGTDNLLPFPAPYFINISASVFVATA